MKKIAGKIAMILILVMLANNFAGCTLFLPIFAMGDIDKEESLERIGNIIDVVLVLAIVVAIGVVVMAEAPNETGIYLTSVENNLLTDYYPAIEFFNSLPETERAAVMEKLNSLPEAKLDALVSAVASLPQAEIAASIERLKALSETELVSTVRTINALSEAEFDALVKEINSKAKAENVVLADNFMILPGTNIVSLKNDLQYYNVGMRLCFQ